MCGESIFSFMRMYKGLLIQCTLDVATLTKKIAFLQNVSLALLYMEPIIRHIYGSYHPRIAWCLGSDSSLSFLVDLLSNSCHQEQTKWWRLPLVDLAESWGETGILVFALSSRCMPFLCKWGWCALFIWNGVYGLSVSAS